MIGKTNVGGGGSNFVAYIAVTTDPNAQIAAVNLAGDTYSGTASGSGSLILTVRNPGTYTVTETAEVSATATVVVSDYGATYSVTLYFFGGYLIRNGLYTAYDMDELGIWSGGGGVIANLSVTQGVYVTVGLEGYTCAELESTSGNTSQCCLVSAEPIDLTDYSTLKMTGFVENQMTFGAAIFTRVFDPYDSATMVVGTSGISTANVMETVSVDVSSYSGEYYVGAYIGRSGNPNVMDAYIKDLYLE